MTNTDRLIGLSAGKICYSNIEAADYTQRKVIEAAELMWESYKSAWALHDYTLDGTTLWASPNERYTVSVSPDGTLSRPQESY